MISEMFKKFAQADIDEQREVSDDFIEFVVESNKCQIFDSILKEFLGEPIKKAGEEASSEVQKIADEFGGIQKDQTLYYASKEGQTVIVMYWPWQDGLRTTIKLIKL